MVKGLHFQGNGHEFDPWSGKFHMLWGEAKKKKKSNANDFICHAYVTKPL